MLLKIHTVRFVQDKRTAIPISEHSRYGINVDSVWFMASKTRSTAARYRAPPVAPSDPYSSTRMFATRAKSSFPQAHARTVARLALVQPYENWKDQCQP